jgi:hypothetical protein
MAAPKKGKKGNADATVAKAKANTAGGKGKVCPREWTAAWGIAVQCISSLELCLFICPHIEFPVLCIAHGYF